MEIQIDTVHNKSNISSCDDKHSYFSSFCCFGNRLLSSRRFFYLSSRCRCSFFSFSSNRWWTCHHLLPLHHCLRRCFSFSRSSCCLFTDLHSSDGSHLFRILCCSWLGSDLLNNLLLSISHG